MLYRPAEASDVAGLAHIRSLEWGDQKYWERRVAGYLAGDLNPQQALAPRTCFVAIKEGAAAGLAAGHLTTRYGCDGELQWINVLPEYRRLGVASGLLRLLADWFLKENARRICVDVEPENRIARDFYTRRGAEPLNDHWLVWKDIGCLQAH